MTGIEIGATFHPAEYGTYFPKLQRDPAFCRVFAGDGEGLPGLYALSKLPAGCIPWISHKDPLPIGVVDAYWSRLAGRYPGKRLRWTFFHEAAPLPPAARLSYLRYWSALVAAARDHPLIIPTQIQSNYAMRWRPDTNWRDWIIRDVPLAFDCYPLTGYRYEPPESMFGLLHAAAAEFGISDYGIAELGAGTRPGQNRGAWLKDCVKYLDTSYVDFVGLWGAGMAYAPTDPALLEAFVDIVGQ